MRFQITPPRWPLVLDHGAQDRGCGRQDADNHTGDTSLAAVRLRADLAIEHLALLEAAAAARHRSGTWVAAAANDQRDYRALAFAEDATRTPRKR